MSEAALPAPATVVLGSQSAQRRALLVELLGGAASVTLSRVAGAAGVRVTLAPKLAQPAFRKADIDEKAVGDRHSGNLKELAVEIARAKAAALLPALRGERQRGLPLRWLITGDTVVEYDGQVREKPAGREEALAFMRSYGQARCSVVSGFVVTDMVTGKQFEGTSVDVVRFSPFLEAVVVAVVDKGEVFTAAGGLTIEEPLMAPYLLGIDGSEDSVRGMPKALVARLLREAVAACGAEPSPVPSAAGAAVESAPAAAAAGAAVQMAEKKPKQPKKAKGALRPKPAAAAPKQLRKLLVLHGWGQSGAEMAKVLGSADPAKLKKSSLVQN